MWRVNSQSCKYVLSTSGSRDETQGPGLRIFLRLCAQILTTGSVRPHPHWTRREKPSKFGGANPFVATVLYTLHAKQHVMHIIRTWLHFVASHIAWCLLLPVWMRPKQLTSYLAKVRIGPSFLQCTPAISLFVCFGCMGHPWHISLSPPAAPTTTHIRARKTTEIILLPLPTFFQLVEWDGTMKNRKRNQTQLMHSLPYACFFVPLADQDRADLPLLDETASRLSIFSPAISQTGLLLQSATQNENNQMRKAQEAWRKLPPALCGSALLVDPRAGDLQPELQSSPQSVPAGPTNDNFQEKETHLPW